MTEEALKKLAELARNNCLGCRDHLPLENGMHTWADRTGQELCSGVDNLALAKAAYELGEKAGRSEKKEVVDAANALIESDGHATDPQCHFSGCTCGRIELYKAARAEYLRVSRKTMRI